MPKCIDCAHYTTCKSWDDYDQIGYGNVECFNCYNFLNKKFVTVNLDWDTYEDILEAVKNTRMHTAAIRKSKNKDSALFELDKIEYLIKGVGNVEVN